MIVIDLMVYFFVVLLSAIKGMLQLYWWLVSLVLKRQKGPDDFYALIKERDQINK